LFGCSTNSGDIVPFPWKKHQPGLRIPEKSPGSDTHPVFGFLFDIKTNDSYTEAEIIRR
jgi:hypothetical protein